jgi:hypothetical protein
MESAHPKGTRGACLIFLSSVLLAACGGGGGGGGPPPTYTIGGSVSGLVGTVVLQNNGGDNLSLTSNGSFHFPNVVASGGPYAVSVLTQPMGPSCSVTDASGAATSNVSSVSVVCTADPSTFYLPLAARPPMNTTVGSMGLYAVSSKVLDRPPAAIMSGTTSSTGYSLSFAMDSLGHLSGGTPFALAFSTQGAAGGDHVYAVDLRANSTLAATQISNITFLANVNPQNCGIETAYENLTDPSSMFFIIGLPTDPSNVCGTGQSFKRLLVHINDSPTTAPIELPFITGTILALYQPGGALAGFLMTDSANNLNFYPGQTFTDPIALLANVHDFGPQQTAPLSLLTNVSADPTYSMLNVVFTNLSTSLYRIDYTGTLSQDLYDFAGQYGGVFDSHNYYLEDTVNFNSPQSGTIAQVPLDGSSKALVLFQYTLGNPLSIAGVTGSQLVLEGGPAGTPTLYTLPVGNAGSPTPIATFSDFFALTVQSDDLFVTESQIVGSGANAAPIYFTTSMMADGTILQQRTASSSFLISNSEVLLQITGATDPTGLGGGSVFMFGLVQPASPTQTVLNDTSGAPFKVSSGVQYAAGSALTPTIGYVTAESDVHYFTYVYDLSKNLMLSVSLPGSDLLMVQAPN